MSESPSSITDPASATPRSHAPGSHRGAALALAGLMVVAGVLVGIHYVAGLADSTGPGGPIPVVAAENFWGSLIAQLGGSHVAVTSIVSDPNADPHEYEVDTANAIAVAQARLVIENGAGYDDWCAHLVAAASSPNQVVLNVATLLGKVAGDNPHFWYGAAYVNATLAAMFGDLVTLDPAGANYYHAQFATLNASLAPVYARESAIRSQFQGTPVASTESLFVYMANSAGLDLVSPPAFMDAVAEGNDPPAASVTQFQDQLVSGDLSVLVYNEQTVTPLTQQMEALAAQHNISVVGVTETIQPPGLSFEEWMGGELLSLQIALQQTAAGA